MPYRSRQSSSLSRSSMSWAIVAHSEGHQSDYSKDPLGRGCRQWSIEWMEFRFREGVVFREVRVRGGSAPLFDQEIFIMPATWDSGKELTGSEN